MEARGGLGHLIIDAVVHGDGLRLAGGEVRSCFVFARRQPPKVDREIHRQADGASQFGLAPEAVVCESDTGLRKARSARERQLGF